MSRSSRLAAGCARSSCRECVVGCTVMETMLTFVWVQSHSRSRTEHHEEHARHSVERCHVSEPRQMTRSTGGAAFVPFLGKLQSL